MSHRNPLLLGSGGEVVAPDPTVTLGPQVARRQFRAHGELPPPSAIAARQRPTIPLIPRNTAAPPVLNFALADEGAREAARLIRAARLRDMLAAIEEWKRADGPDRAWWRSHGSHLIREWRRLYRSHWRHAA